MTQDFWNRAWTEFEPFELNPATFREKTGQSDKVFLNLVGEVDGKNVLDIGCGNGMLSVYLAKMGGRVTAIDNSLLAVKNTIALAKINQVDPLIRAYRLNAIELNNLGQSFDVVVGKFILHHIEPFEIFSEVLLNVMTKDGRGIFFENNSRNPILIFFRTFFVGRLGIPKYGDIEEYPFEPREIEILRQRFDSVCVHYPVFMFFTLMSPYLFKHNKKLRNVFSKMDKWVYNHWSIFHKYSYHQIIEVRKF
jgi:SAM-dependent methyltransferase